MLKRIFIFLLFVIGVLVVVLLFNTLTFKSRQVYEEVKPAPRVTDTTLLHLRQAIQYKTVAVSDPATFDSATFKSFHDFIRTTYPLTHSKLSLQTFVGSALLYKWEGSDSTKNPFILMAHQDVVPVEEETLDLWTMEPFAGIITDESIWGRGAADNKINLIGILEAVEKLLTEGFVPQRTIYLVFGHDEEVGGTGARAIAAYLKAQNVTADLVIDEGGFVTKDKVPGMTMPVALVGISEKGYLSLELTVEIHGGHSSQPAKESAMTILARALVALHENPYPARFTIPTEGFLDYVGPEMPYPDKIVFANRWLFKPVIVSIYEQSTGGNALVRTTSALTIFHSGIKDNVIPTQAKATVNFRLLPGDNTDGVTARVKRIINDDRVTISKLTEFVAEPSPITPIDGFAFNLVSKTVHKVFPETVTAPFLMIAGTDSRLMTDVSNQIIKFSPMTDPFGYHGIDERVSIESVGETIWFFENLIRSANTN